MALTPNFHTSSVHLPIGHALVLTAAASGTGAGTLIDYDGDGISSRRPRGTTRDQFTGPSSYNLNLRAEQRFRVGAGMEAIWRLCTGGLVFVGKVGRINLVGRRSS